MDEQNLTSQENLADENTLEKSITGGTADQTEKVNTEEKPKADDGQEKSLEEEKPEISEAQKVGGAPFTNVTIEADQVGAKAPTVFVAEDGKAPLVFMDAYALRDKVTSLEEKTNDLIALHSKDSKLTSDLAKKENDIKVANLQQLIQNEIVELVKFATVTE